MYTEQKFNIPELKGISKKSVDEHLKLYAGYVKSVNLIHEVVENTNNPEYARRETYRRLGFEFAGMRNHEIYFSQFEGGAKKLPENSLLSEKIVEWCGSFETFITIFNNLATTRGVGWAMLGYDKKTSTLAQYWVDEQHIGHLPTITPVLALDMWEHSFYMDYGTNKKGYVDAFFENLNWEVVEQNFKNVM